MPVGPMYPMRSGASSCASERCVAVASTGTARRCDTSAGIPATVNASRTPSRQRDVDDRGRHLRPSKRWLRTGNDHEVASKVSRDEIDLRPVDDAIAVVGEARDGPRLLQVHEVGEIERAEQVGIGKLIAQHLNGPGAGKPGVDPTRKRDHECRVVQLRPTVDLDRDHVRNVRRGWIASVPVRLRIFTEPQQGATYEQLLGVAQTAEALGFDAFFRSDHYQRIGEGAPGPGSTDAWLTLAAIGRETSRIRLGTLVTPVTFRFPGPLAIQVAQADAMSGGRVELGLGAGWYDGEHAAYGIPFPPTADRFADARGAARDRDRPVGNAARGDVFVRGTAPFDRRLPRPAEARAAATPADHPRGLGHEAHAAARGALRRRIQPAVRSA